MCTSLVRAHDRRYTLGRGKESEDTYMALVRTRYEHVVLGDDGVPVIAGTTMKVVELVVERIAYGWSPEELHFQHPYLTLGQIHSALAYYWDHQDELDQDIEQRLRRVDDLQSTSPTSPLVARLKVKREKP
jgi:uncharacterized protein (DUF433 family)